MTSGYTAVMGFLEKPGKPTADVTGQSGQAMDRRIARSAGWRVRRRFVLATAVLCGVLILAVMLWLTPAPGTLMVDAAAIEVGEAVREPFIDYLPLRAEAEPLRVVIVATATGGQVVDVIAVDGAVVRRGAPLARLVNPELEQDVAQREVEIASRLAELSAQELDIQRSRLDLAGQHATASNEWLRAEDELQKREHLYAEGIVSEAGIRTYRRDAAFRRKQVDALTRGQSQESATADRQLAQNRQIRAMLQQNLGMMRARLDDLILRSPITGRLTGFGLQSGQTVRSGESVARIAEGQTHKLVADVDEFYLRRVAPGQRASAAIDGTRHRLVVLKTLPQVANGRFRTELAFVPASPAQLRIGQAIDVRLSLGGARPAIVAPAGAWADAGGAAFVATAASPDGFERRQLTLGRRTPEQVEVVSGLAPGDRLITSSIASYADIDRIRVR